MITWEDVNENLLTAAARLGDSMYVLIENTHDPAGVHAERERLWLARIEMIEESRSGGLTTSDLIAFTGVQPDEKYKRGVKKSRNSYEVMLAFQPLCDYYTQTGKREGRPWDAWEGKRGTWWDGVPREFRCFNFRHHTDRPNVSVLRDPLVDRNKIRNVTTVPVRYSEIAGSDPVSARIVQEIIAACSSQ